MPYPPSEDSYFLEKELKIDLEKRSRKEREKIKVLDMGSGSGIQAKACIKEGIKKSNMLCADIDKEAIKYLKEKKLRTIHTNLFQRINKKQKFDLIIFNTPYLPEDEYDKEKDTTGGKEGYETTVEFLKQAKSYLKKEGKMIILFSSLSKPKIILKQVRLLNLKAKKLAEKNMGFFEKILVYEIKKH